MNRITRMKAVRRGTVAAATIAALVASGAAIAGASGTGVAINTRGALELTHAHHANHDHGHHGIHHIEGVISSLDGPLGSPLSMVVTTRQNTLVTVDLSTNTAVTMEHGSGPLTLANLAAGERVSVTPVSGSSLASLMAASVKIQVPEIHHIEGTIASFETTTNNVVTSMVVNTGHSGTVTVNFAPTTNITMEHASGSMTPANLVVGERVNVTPSSTSTPGNYVAASVRVQATEIHPIEGVVYSVNGAASMVMTNRDRGSITVFFTPTTSVLMNHTSTLITSTSVTKGERVNVTPASTSTPTSFVAASVRIQVQDK